MIDARRLPSLVLTLALAGCGGESADPRAQWLVRIGTDARVPQFGDRVLIQVLSEQGECDGCERLVAVDAGSWPLSFGIVAEQGAAPRVRARLFRALLLGPAGEPEGSAYIDRVVDLPATSGKTEVELVLSMDCFGVAADLATGRSCDPSTGALAPDGVAGRSQTLPEMGSWSPGQDRACAGSAPDGMACIAGGAFLLGAVDGVSVEPALRTTPERLTRLDPFWLDREELSVGRARALLSQHPEIPLPASPGSQAGSEHCTFLGLTDATNDALPLSCVPRFVAEMLCEARGARIPTEAEWEFAAGNRSSETRYPWGDDADVCAHALVSRGVISDQECVEDGAAAGLGSGGGEGDVTTDGEIHNLGGSVSEWVADDVATFDAPCWSPDARLLENPKCTGATPSPYALAVRGGNWNGPTFLARASGRIGATMDGISSGVGMRCARSAGAAQ